MQCRTCHTRERVAIGAVGARKGRTGREWMNVVRKRRRGGKRRRGKREMIIEES